MALNWWPGISGPPASPHKVLGLPVWYVQPWPRQALGKLGRHSTSWAEFLALVHSLFFSVVFCCSTTFVCLLWLMVACSVCYYEHLLPCCCLHTKSQLFQLCYGSVPQKFIFLPMMKLRLKKIFLKLAQVDTCSRGNVPENHKKTHFIVLDFWQI